MRRLACIAVALALAMAGCGGDDEQEGAKIPPENAEAISNQLDAIRDQAERGNCGSARFQAKELRQKIEALPPDVSQDVRDALIDGVEKLETAVEAECEEPAPTTTEETTTEAPTETAPPPPETTETQPETTTEEEPPPDEEPAPDEEQPGDGGTTIPPLDGDGGANAPGDEG
jgi:hypothetical protein